MAPIQIWFELIAGIDYHPSRNYKLCHYTKIYLLSIWCGRFPGYDIQFFRNLKNPCSSFLTLYFAKQSVSLEGLWHFQSLITAKLLVSKQINGSLFSYFTIYKWLCHDKIVLNLVSITYGGSNHHPYDYHHHILTTPRKPCNLRKGRFRYEKNEVMRRRVAGTVSVFFQFSGERLVKSRGFLA